MGLPQALGRAPRELRCVECVPRRKAFSLLRRYEPADEQTREEVIG